MGKYLDLADKATGDAGSPANRSATHSEKSEVSEISPDDRLRHLAGDDWEEIAADPAQLAALEAAAATAELVQQGVVPNHYTATTTCRRCGPVPIFPGCPPTVEGCPWCLGRGRRGGRAP